MLQYLIIQYLQLGQVKKNLCSISLCRHLKMLPTKQSKPWQEEFPGHFLYSSPSIIVVFMRLCIYRTQIKPTFFTKHSKYPKGQQQLRRWYKCRHSIARLNNSEILLFFGAWFAWWMGRRLRGIIALLSVSVNMLFGIVSQHPVIIVA